MTAAVGRPAWFALDTTGEVPTMPSAAAPRRADVVVVGLGASGLAACRRLAVRGAAVVGLDAVGVAGGAAGANGGFLLAGLARFHHDAVGRLGRQRAAAAYRWTLDLLDEVLATEPTARRTGSLRLAADAAEVADVAAQAAALRADGFAVQAHDGPEGVGLRIPDDGVVQPVSRCRRLAAEVVAAGARLVAPAAVDAVDGDGVGLVGGGRVGARAVVVAVDGGLERLLPELARSHGVRTARLQMLATAPDHGVDRPRPEYRRWGRDYVQQLPSGQVLLGGGRDVGGTAEWEAPPTPTSRVQAHLDRELDRLGVVAPVTHRWAARAAFTADLLPVATTVRDHVHVVGAYSGHGNLLGPALGERAADAALDGHALVDPFRPR